MHRFFINKDDIKEDRIFITGEDVKHISKVLRLRIKDEIVVCDGNGMDYYSTIEHMDKHTVIAKIISKEYTKSEPKINVVLYQGIPKRGKMDIIIQKCTELGVSKIVPVLNSRNVVKLSDKKDEKKKVERWQRIAIEAAKQSRRGKVPIVEFPKSFEEALMESQELDISIIPYELERANTLKNSIHGKNISHLGIFIGPEGGYENEEIMESVDKGVIPVTLGPRILRTETAGAAVLSCVMYEFDEMQYNWGKDIE